VSLAEQRKEFRRNKSIKKIKYLTPGEFGRVINGESPSRFLEDKSDREKFETRRVTLKNQIDRLTATTGGEGQLFPFPEFYWHTVSIYLKVEDEFVDRAESLFDYLAKAGYGKRKSVGYGQVKAHTFKPFDGFPSPTEANGFITLSNFVPSGKDPANGNWSHLVKYGKLAEVYSLEEMAFKKPLLMLEAGSTFYDSPVRPFYGRMACGVSTARPQVVQYGFALPVAARLRPLEGAA
jgi:CRISPR-associated protein Csm4